MLQRDKHQEPLVLVVVDQHPDLEAEAVAEPAKEEVNHKVRWLTTKHQDRICVIKTNSNQ